MLTDVKRELAVDPVWTEVSLVELTRDSEFVEFILGGLLTSVITELDATSVFSTDCVVLDTLGNCVMGTVVVFTSACELFDDDC